VPVDYFPPATDACPTFVGNTEWLPLIDGVEYFAALDEALDGLGEGDGVVIAGLTVDPALDLAGRTPGEAAYRPLGARLADAARRGAVVRVLIAGRVLASSVSLSALGDFRTNVARARTLREWRPDGASSAPLAETVLLDFGGSLLGANHQKVVVVSRGGVLTAFVGGIDLEDNRYDGPEHDRLRHDGERWGWHDMAVRLRGPAAGRVWGIESLRWREAATLPRKRYLRDPLHLEPLNPGSFAPPPPEPVTQAAVAAPDTSVRVLLSLCPRKFDSLLPWRRIRWDHLPDTGYQEIFDTLRTAIANAQRYVYIEDQYLCEELGGRRAFTLYPYLRDAAARGVKVVLVGSGVRDPDDPGIHLRPINRVVNSDVREQVLDRLDDAHRGNVVVHRLEHATVHAKLVLIDDVFACVGSANMFSRSMAGIDNELSAAVQTSTSLVRDLRVRVWGEHLRTSMGDGVRAALESVDLALGIWHEDWLPSSASRATWRKPGEPAGFAPTETVLVRVGEDG
jgi:phosphatidylserine/phosphatidylglycerophosphate/cardiolipin synthase-like enzyme